MKQIVIMPGGFHPFHAGHLALYQSAVKAFPGAEVYVAASNDMSERPFPFAVKEKLAKVSGVPKGRFVQVKSPFRPVEIMNQYDPDSDVLIFVRSEKDRNEQPKPGGTKKDGSLAYFQPYTGKDLKPFSQHAYMSYLPTVEFGPGITSATEIRNAWPKLNDKRKLALVMSLYPATQSNEKLGKNVVAMLDSVLGGQQGVAGGLTETRNSLFAFVKQHFPTWPDYVLKDFLYQQAKGIRDQAELDDFLKRNKQDFGNCKWTLTKLPITFDIFTPKTQRMLASREGGSSNPFQVPRDAERHALQSQMIQQKGVSAEPIIVAKLANGYDLIEGWHRTIQHLKAFPQGYTGPAWVCTGATYKSESVEQGVAGGSLEELANTSLKVKEPKDFVNTNDRKQVTYKVMKFKSGKDTYLINFTVKGAPAFGKKQNWNAVNVSFGVREEQDDYSFGDEINTDLTAKNKNQFLIYSTVINAVRKFITEYNTEIDEIIMQGAGERQEAIYQRFFQSAGKYFPGWHHDGKHSLVRDVPRQQTKKVKEQGVEEDEFEEGIGKALGTAALAGSLALGGLSQMGKTTDTNWNEYEQQISGQRDTTGGEKIMSVAGPNSKGEYRVRITTDNDMQEFITKTPPKSLEEDKESDPVTSAVLNFYKPVVNDIHKEKLPDYVDQARELLHKTNDPDIRGKLVDIFKKGKENPYMQGGIVTTVGAVLAGGILNTAQQMGLSPAQTNLALQAILNTVIPTVVSRINGKNWSDTIKYTLASAGIGTGIAGASLIENDPWGDQGNFAGDRPVNIGGSFTRTKLGVGDMVKVNAGHYKGLGEIAEIKGDQARVWMSSYSRSFVFDLSDLVKYIPESIDYLEEK